jgi:hypothetical protein
LDSLYTKMCIIFVLLFHVSSCVLHSSTLSLLENKLRPSPVFFRKKGVAFTVTLVNPPRIPDEDSGDRKPAARGGEHVSGRFGNSKVIATGVQGTASWGAKDELRGEGRVEERRTR